MRYLIVVFLCLLCNVSYGSVEDILDSTCHVITKHGSGTGVVFSLDETHYYALTAGHVLTGANAVPDTVADVYFYLDGQATEKIAAEVVWREYTVSTTDDLGILKFKIADCPAIKVMPLVAPDYKLSVDEVVYSYGAARGVFPTLWRGKITGVDESRIFFWPVPAPGRSGSGLFDKDGDHLVAIVVMTNDAKGGIAVPIDKIYAKIKGKVEIVLPVVEQPPAPVPNF